MPAATLAALKQRDKKRVLKETASAVQNTRSLHERFRVRRSPRSQLLDYEHLAKPRYTNFCRATTAHVSRAVKMSPGAATIGARAHTNTHAKQKLALNGTARSVTPQDLKKQTRAVALAEEGGNVANYVSRRTYVTKRCVYPWRRTTTTPRKRNGAQHCTQTEPRTL